MKRKKHSRSSSSRITSRSLRRRSALPVQSPQPPGCVAEPSSDVTETSPQPEVCPDVTSDSEVEASDVPKASALAVPSGDALVSDSTEPSPASDSVGVPPETAATSGLPIAQADTLPSHFRGLGFLETLIAPEDYRPEENDATSRVLTRPVRSVWDVESHPSIL